MTKISQTKRALVLHGTDGRPDSNWFPWLKNKLEAAGHEVWAPQLPDAHVPNRQTWNNFILDNGFDLTDGIIVGHSAGAVEVLNLLMDERMLRIKLGVLAGAWAGGYPEGVWDPGTFDHFFPPEGFDFKLIKSNADKLAFLHGSDDPYCPLEQARYLADQLGAPLTIIPNGHHLGHVFSEFPQLWRVIEPSL